MREFVDAGAGSYVSAEVTEAVEFERRLADSSTLAFRVAFSVLRQREDAEDVAQEAITRAFQRFGQLRDRDRFRAWLVRMTWRLAIDRRRGERRRGARELQVAPFPSVAATVEQQLVADERSARLWQAIDALPEKQRMVIVLAAIEEIDLGAVAQLTGVPVGTVKSRLHVARKRLEELLR